MDSSPASKVQHIHPLTESQGVRAVVVAGMGDSVVVVVTAEPIGREGVAPVRPDESRNQRMNKTLQTGEPFGEC